MLVRCGYGLVIPKRCQAQALRIFALMRQGSKKVLICAGKMTVNSRFGAKVAVLAGDFLFAQSSWFLANLDNLEVLLHQAECDSADSAVYLSFHQLLG